MAMVVPFTQPQPSAGPVPGPALPEPDPTFVMMAAAQMHNEGRLIKPQLPEQSDVDTKPNK